MLLTLLKRLCRNLRRCFAFVLVFLGSLVTLQILSRHTRIPDILHEAERIANSFPFKPSLLSRHPREGRMKEPIIASGVTESNLGSWVQHLCPHYHADEMKVKGHTRLAFEMPTEDAIFFTQTSCRTFLSPREVSPLGYDHKPKGIFGMALLGGLGHTQGWFHDRGGSSAILLYLEHEKKKKKLFGLWKSNGYIVDEAAVIGANRKHSFGMAFLCVPGIARGSGMTLMVVQPCICTLNLKEHSLHPD